MERDHLGQGITKARAKKENREWAKYQSIQRQDPWVTRPPSFLPITQGINEDLRVSDLIQEPGKWNSALIQQIYLSPDAQSILTIPLSPFNHIDSWLWHYTKNGNYSVKSGYNLAMSKASSSPSSSTEVLSNWWTFFWKIKIPRKILIFGWRGFHEILPTNKGLYRRNVSPNSRCPVCGGSEDTNAHAVFWCSFAQQRWGLLDFPFLVGQKDKISFKEVLCYASDLLEKDSMEKWLISTWGIWIERNKKTHEQPRNPEQLKRWLSAFYVEVKNAQTSEGETVHGERNQRGQPEIEIQDLTLCVDAATSTNDEMVGLGTVIFSTNRRPRAGLSKPLKGGLSVLHAEALALLVGLRWAQNIGLPIKNIYSDSLSLVKALKNTHEFYNELGILLSDIQRVVASFHGAAVTHMKRVFNTTAHNLAKRALQLEEEESWMEDFTHNTEDHL